MSPAWCAKPKPCDYDKGSSYCPHRECRIALEIRLEEVTKQRDSAENRWKLAMRRLHERFGDGLAVHKADLEKLLASWETDKGVRVEVYDGPNTTEPK